MTDDGNARAGDKGIAIGLADVRVSVRGAVLVDGVTLEVPAGGAWSIIGPSGAGKTTLLRLIAGFVAPSAGVVNFDGREVAGAGQIRLGPGERRIGYLPQDLGLWDHLSVAAHLDVPLKAAHPARTSAARREAVMAMLSRLGLTMHSRRRAGTLSGGERHRLAIGRALIASPGVLLLDEPFSGLDYGLRDELVAVLGELRHSPWAGARPFTLLAVTHLREEVLRLTDTVAVMAAGRLVERGALRQIESAPQSPFAQRFFAREW